MTDSPVSRRRKTELPVSRRRRRRSTDSLISNLRVCE
jgi:hypothetical protein